MPLPMLQSPLQSSACLDCRRRPVKCRSVYDLSLRRSPFHIAAGWRATCGGLAPIAYPFFCCLRSGEIAGRVARRTTRRAGGEARCPFWSRLRRAAVRGRVSAPAPAAHDCDRTDQQDQRGSDCLPLDFCCAVDRTCRGNTRRRGLRGRYWNAGADAQQYE